MRQSRLNGWQFIALFPPIIIFLLGVVGLVFGARLIAWVAVVLPMIWCIIASVLILNLRPDERFMMRNTFQPPMFFLFWCGSTFATGWLLPHFPSLGSSYAPSVGFVNIANSIYTVVIVAVMITFFYQSRQDKRKKRIY